MKLSVHIERWQAAKPLRITGRVFEYFDCVVVELQVDDISARGEALGVYYEGETAQSILDAIEGVRSEIESGVSRLQLLKLLPPGGARHAVDQALWDLECKSNGDGIWALTGINPKPVYSGMTIGILSSPEEMAARATELNRFQSLKIKLDEDRPVERVEAVRAARPDATIHVDANQAWSIEQLKKYATELERLDVAMIEQPLPRHGDAGLEDFRSPVPLCADESCLHLGELEAASTRYQMINIKLDKAGGLTHGLELAAAAREKSMGLMIGCMGGTSLAMAPAFVIACIADLVDIDGPPWLKCDRPFGMDYRTGQIAPFDARLWG